MQETRIKKYKNYRLSLNQVEPDVLPYDVLIDNSENKTAEDVLSEKRQKTPTSSTLSVPFDEIMKATNSIDNSPNEKKYYDKKKILKITLIIVACILIAAAIIASAIVIFM